MFLNRKLYFNSFMSKHAARKFGELMATKNAATKKPAGKKTVKKAPIDKVAAAEKAFFGSKDDHPEDRSVSSRRRIHDQVNNQVEDFLARGGCISEIAPHVTAETEDQAGASYGSRPI